MERKKTKTGDNWWTTALMALFMVAVLLLTRHLLAGWLLPDGRYLEILVQKIQTGEEPPAEAVFSWVGEWLTDG